MFVIFQSEKRIRCRTRATQTGLRRQVSEALFGEDNAREREITRYFLSHPGFVLIMDETNHLMMDGNMKSACNLDSIRDYYDEVQEAGGRLGIVFIFTEYSLERLRKCRIASFLKQFINRGDNHLYLPNKISRAYEIIPTLNALLGPDAVDNDLIDAACRFTDIRSLHKRIATAKEWSAKTNTPVSAEVLAGLQAQYESGDYSDENEKE